MNHESDYDMAMGAGAAAGAEQNAAAQAEYEATYMVGPASAIGVLNQFSTSAEGINRFSRLVGVEVEEGRENPLKVALVMKTLEKIVKNVNDSLSAYYLREATKYSEKTFNYAGAEITVGDVATSYDYASCGDPVWNDLQKIVAHASEQMKEREKTLKTLTRPMVEVIDGEAIEIKPPVRKSKEGIKISIK